MPALRTQVRYPYFENRLVDKSSKAFYDVVVAATIEHVLKRTRTAILNCLRSDQRLTVEDLAALVGVSKVCIRRHLSLLGRDQLIAYDVERRDRGRPLHVYYLTSKSESLFPTGYAAFAQGVLRQVGCCFGEPAVNAVIAGWTEEAIGEFQSELANRKGEQRIHGLVSLLNRNGYEAESKRLENGDYVIEQRNCPVLTLAREHQQICDEELRLYKSSLGFNVERECRIANGSSCCTYKIFLSETARPAFLQ
ncbi:MAG: helix-turn-helix transcriptional regulator [Blastocatellia bacterium]